MTTPKIKINQSVAILCDGNNIERSLHEKIGRTGAMLNFDVMIPKLLNGRGLNRLIYFREGKNISDKLAGRLHENYYGSVVPCHKSADIPLSIKATQLASKVDTIIIMSGDSDYVDLVNHLRSEGVRVEIAAVKQNASRYLLQCADYFHEIREGDYFMYNKGRSGYNSRGPRKTYPAPAKAESDSSAKPVSSDPAKVSMPEANTPVSNAVKQAIHKSSPAENKESLAVLVEKSAGDSKANTKVPLRRPATPRKKSVRKTVSKNTKAALPVAPAETKKERPAKKIEEKEEPKKTKKKSSLISRLLKK